jgi:thioredoxin-dependent peroxiredoxin
MATIKFKGNDVHTVGNLPAVGRQAPDFQLVAADLSTKSLSDFAGKKKILTINPSFDTGVCQKAAHNFNEKVAGRSDTVVLLISADLPFAQKRFCEADGIQTSVPLSSFRSEFSNVYGTRLTDGPLQGLNARAVLVLDANNQVKYTELVPEITTEPNYAAALAALG